MGTTGTRRTGRALAFAVGAAAVALPFIGFSTAPSASAVPTTPPPITGSATLPSFPATTDLTIEQIPATYRDHLTEVTLTATVEGEVDGLLSNRSETLEKSYTTSIDVGITVTDEGIISDLVAEASASDALTIPDGGLQPYLLSADDSTSETIAGDELNDAVLDLLVGDGDVTFSIDSFVETTVGGPAPWLSTGLAEGVATVEMEYTYDIPELAECPQGTIRIDLPGTGAEDEDTYALGDTGYAFSIDQFAVAGDAITHDWSSPDVGINRIVARYGLGGEHEVDVDLVPPAHEGTLASTEKGGSGDHLDLEQVCVGITPPEICEDFEKIEPVKEGVYLDGRFEITAVDDTPKGPTFDWTSTVDVFEILVKGGPGGKLYTYDPPQQSDTDLHAPLNSNNDKYHGLSHIRVCLDEKPPEVCPYDPDLDMDDPKCEPPKECPDANEVKVDNLPDRLVEGATYTSGAVEITITKLYDDKSFDWTSNVPVFWMTVKGGSGQNGGGDQHFPDLGGVLSGKAWAPENPNSAPPADYFGASHITLCVGEEPPEVCPYDPDLDMDDPKCEPPKECPDANEVKVDDLPDPLVEGATYTSGAVEITITKLYDDKSFDWTSNVPVFWMTVKGGSGQNGGGDRHFPDLGGVMSGTAWAPENANSAPPDDYFGASHITVCVGDPVDECPEAGLQTNTGGGDDCPPDCPEPSFTKSGGDHGDDLCPPDCPEQGVTTQGGDPGDQDCPPPPPPGECVDKTKIEGFGGNPKVDETYWNKQDTVSLTITAVHEDKSFDWESNVPVYWMLVKGGPGAESHPDFGGATSGTAWAPLNPNTKNDPDDHFGLSNIKLCVDFPDEGAQQTREDDEGKGRDEGRKNSPAAPQSDDPEPNPDEPTQPDRKPAPKQEKPKPEPKPTEPVKPKPDPEPAPETKEPEPKPKPEKQKAEPPEKESTPPAPSKASSDEDEEEEAA